MIKVLQDWNEVGASIMRLQAASLPLHITPQKNWDHSLVIDLAANVDRQDAVLDLGCGPGLTLQLLSSAGFKDLNGIDLGISARTRLMRLVRRFGRPAEMTYKFRSGDITKTNWAGSSFGLLTCISVIEHGVSITAFLRECARLLRPGGLLLITTDYWAEKIETERGLLAYGLPWQVFDERGIKSVIAEAAEHGLKLLIDQPIPACRSKITCWNGKEYTFIALAFRRS